MTELDSTDKTCEVAGCTKPSRARKMCTTHYVRSQRNKPLDAPVRTYKTYDDAPGFRTCSKCEETKKDTEFYRYNDHLLRRKCKSCTIEDQ